ncbi:MAG TPA: Fur family transcriptional regulator [Acidimicrobiia bacterium]
MTNSHHDRQIQRRLTDAGSRYTPGRRMLVGVLADGSGPRSVAELAEALEGAVPVSSLYRSLAVLDEAGVVVQHFGPGGMTRYELAEWLTGHHHHAVCTECGSVEDIELGESAEASLDGMLVGLSRSTGWDLTGHSLEVEGVCRTCRS